MAAGLPGHRPAHLQPRPSRTCSPYGQREACSQTAVNGTELWSLPLSQANNTYPEWAGPIAVNLSAYAGQSVTLTFGGISEGSLTGNALIDCIRFITEAMAVERSTWRGVKALFRQG